MREGGIEGQRGGSGQGGESETVVSHFPACVAGVAPLVLTLSRAASPAAVRLATHIVGDCVRHFMLVLEWETLILGLTSRRRRTHCNLRADC